MGGASSEVGGASSEAGGASSEVGGGSVDDTNYLQAEGIITVRRSLFSG